MAQDFGDDAGERLERGIMRLLGELVRGAWRHHAENRGSPSSRSIRAEAPNEDGDRDRRRRP